MFSNIWEDLKIIFTLILSVIVIYGGFWVIIFSILGYDSNKPVVDYDTYVQNTFNINLDGNMQVTEDEKDDNDYITDDIVESLPDSDYKPGKVNHFSDSEPSR